MTQNPLPTLEGQVQQLADGGVTSVELTTRALERIATAQPVLNAFRLLRPEAALAEASLADERLARGERGALLGVPTAIKDDTNLAGYPTAFGCDGNFPVQTEDSELVRRIRAVGAIIVGKTNTPEFGQWPFTEAPWFGATRNPWNVDFSPGGSSGGASAAVAAGLVAATIGSDGAGSVRIPASWTNLVGIKPQRGRISSWPDAEAFQGLTVNGPLARTVADAAYLLDVVSGSHPGDRHQARRPLEPFRRSAQREPAPLRIALSTRAAFSPFRVNLHPEIRAGLERLGAVLGAIGHEVILDDPRYGAVGLSFMPRSHHGLRQWQGRVPDASLLDPRTSENCRNARYLGGPILRAARAHEHRLHRTVGAIFDRVDVVLAPTTAQPPLAIGATDGLSGWQTDRVIVSSCPYAWPWNVLGWPGISVPAGFTKDGLPFGAQLLGPAHSEPLLISLAAQLESVEKWYEKMPANTFTAAGS